MEETKLGKKYCLVSWNTVCKNKSQGGLGVLYLDRMNKALLGKWWVRFQDSHVTNLWKSLLIDKYGSNGFSLVLLFGKEYSKGLILFLLV